MNDHLTLAREYIAIAESDDAKREAYLAAAAEIRSCRDDGLTWNNINDGLRRSERYAQRLVEWADRIAGDTSYAGTSPFGGPDERERKDVSTAKGVLGDDDRRQRAISELDDDDVHAVAQTATNVAVERARAKRSEHVESSEPTAGDLTDGERFDPSEHWADTLVIRVNRNARELASLVKRAGGLLFGSMSPSEAHEYLREAEALIADVRAAAQEQERDRMEMQR